jgi:lysophospholipase L1-like esterase
VKPIKTLAFLLIVSTILIAISFVFPQKGIQVFSFFKLQYPSFNEITGGNFQKNETAENIIKNQLAILEDTSSFDEDEVFVFDSTMESLLDIPIKKKIVFHLDTLKTRIQKIEFAQNNKKLLYQFFKKAEANRKLMRILHYGDSQIEGDRISSFLRNRLQKLFGGSGFGLVPAKPLVKLFSVKQSYSDNWLRYPIFGHKEGAINHNKYGGLGVFCRYMPYNNALKDSTMINSWLKFSASKISYRKDGIWNNLKIFYSNGESPVLTEIYQDDKMVSAKYLSTNTSFKKIQYQFKGIPKSVTIKLSGSDSPDIYAIALDANKGIALDNIPMRGSSGTYFNKMDLKLLNSFYKEMNIGMILLEFGGNVVPSITSKKAAEQYGRWFASQIRTLRKLNPNTPIIVMGVADMSIKEKDKYITYPYLEDVRDMMKKYTQKSGAAYWDMYEAMGGRNSMPEWVKAKPKLATNDYTHYTSRGARLIANMFYNALLYEYQLYKKNN